MNPKSLLRLLSCGLAAALTLPAVGQSFVSADVSASTPTSLRHAPPVELMKDRKLFNVNVRDGVYTVDGLVGKVRLNYEIRDSAYLYFFIPQVGTVILSRNPGPNTLAVQRAFNGKTLEFDAAGHHIVLSSATPLLVPAKKDKHPSPAIYVAFDPGARQLASTPMMGYGATTASPFDWPLSMPEDKTAQTLSASAPPLPQSVLPRTLAVAAMATR